MPALLSPAPPERCAQRPPAPLSAPASAEVEPLKRGAKFANNTRKREEPRSSRRATRRGLQLTAAAAANFGFSWEQAERAGGAAHRGRRLAAAPPSPRRPRPGSARSRSESGPGLSNLTNRQSGKKPSADRPRPRAARPAPPLLCMRKRSARPPDLAAAPAPGPASPPSRTSRPLLLRLLRQPPTLPLVASPPALPFSGRPRPRPPQPKGAGVTGSSETGRRKGWAGPSQARGLSPLIFMVGPGPRELSKRGGICVLWPRP